MSSRAPGARLFESGFFGFVDQFIAAGLIVITHYPKLWHNTLQVVHGCVPLAITSFSAWSKMHLAHLTKTLSAGINDVCGQIKKTYELSVYAVFISTKSEPRTRFKQTIFENLHGCVFCNPDKTLVNLKLGLETD